MAIETELKLRITPQHLARLKRHSLLKDHQLARPVTRRLYNIYFDTPELDLHQSAMALRLRRSGSQWLQTLKGGGSIKAGLHQRNEWEVPVSGAALDFSIPEAAEWDTLVPVALRKKLQPIFVTDFSRSSRIVCWQGAHIEVCMDHGEITTELLSQPICELELELKSGSPRQLFELALSILDIASFEIEVVNKAEYGFRLLGGLTEQPCKSEPPKLTPKDSLPHGLQTALWSCFLHLQKNWRGALAGDDADFLHQIRVALRRLRVLLHFMQLLRDDEILGRFTAEIADMSVALGQVRDWDVFIARTLQPLCKAGAKRDGWPALLANSQTRRAICQTALRAQAHEMQSLMLRFALWMYGDYWTRLAGNKRQVSDLAAHQLNKLAHRFALMLMRLDERDAYQLHELRIMAKKLRYSAEFFGGWFDDTHTGSFLNALVEVQQVLGDINDAAVAYRLLDELVADGTTHRRAMDLVRDAITESLHHHFDVLPRVLRRFDKQQIFWRA
jgi:inorganic triphosphatase YgiF